MTLATPAQTLMPAVRSRPFYKYTDKPQQQKQSEFSQGNTSLTVSNVTACQIEIRDLRTMVDIKSTVQNSDLDHDQEAAEYIAKVRRRDEDNTSNSP